MVDILILAIIWTFYGLVMWRISRVNKCRSKMLDVILDFNIYVIHDPKLRYPRDALDYDELRRVDAKTQLVKFWRKPDSFYKHIHEQIKETLRKVENNAR